MNKRGVHGPFRCCLCTSAIETFDHLLVDCVFTQEVWKMVLHGLIVPIPSQISLASLYTSWTDKNQEKKNKTQVGKTFGKLVQNAFGGKCGWLEMSVFSTTGSQN